MQTSQLASLFAPDRLADLPPAGLVLVQALRLTIIARRRERDPMPLLAERLGSEGHARRILRIVLLAGDVWPEKFTLSPPCCSAMTHDEALLGTMAGLAARGDRPAYDAVSREMLSEDARDVLWRMLRHHPMD
jgi:hypothetical protein